MKQQLPNEGIQEVFPLVVSDMSERIRQGVEEYGQPLSTFNGRDQLLDAYQESQDLTLYLRAKLTEESAETLTVCPCCNAETMRKVKLIQMTPGGTYWTCFECNQITLAVSWCAAGVLKTLGKTEEIVHDETTEEGEEDEKEYDGEI